VNDRSNLLFSSFIKWLEIPQKRQKSFFGQLAVFYILVVITLLIDFSGFSPDVEEGKPCEKAILSPKLISFVDERKTNELRRIEEDKVESVIVPIDTAESEMMGKLNRFLSASTKFYHDIKEKEHNQGEYREDVIASYFPSDRLLEPEQLRDLLSFERPEFDRLKNNTTQILTNLSQEIITNRKIPTIRNKLKNKVASLPGSAKFQQLAGEMLKNALTINALEDEKQTNQRREAASRSVRSVLRTFQKGQTIIEKGVIVTADDIYVLKTIEKQIHKNRLLSLMGNLLLAGLLMVISLSHLRITYQPVLKDSDLYRLLAALWIAALLLGKVVYAFVSAYQQSSMAILLAPLPSIGLLMAILLDSHVAIFQQTLLAILMFVVAESNARFAIVSLLGGIMGVLAWTSSCKDGNIRSSIGWSGVKIGVVNGLALLAVLLLDAESFSNMNFSAIGEVVGCGFSNGILSGILVNGILPYIENFFSLATGSRLLELADLSQPLIKRLAEEAPGTYQHSILVGNLSEAAANEIHADALLTKIGAYFHDIGKLKRPAYFAENQTNKNQHDQLTPYMSSLILVGHIRDGLDLGREYGLPDRVLSLISQHHGTTLISYFYEQAKTDTEGQQVSEDRFRYPGPKPQTKEAAIVMLADSVEAAARTLPQHTHSKIEGLVRKIIENKLNDENQLDESDLTLKDIEKIEQTFVRVLTSMYHGRVDYPGKLSNQPKGAPDGNSHQQPPKEDQV